MKTFLNIFTLAFVLLFSSNTFAYITIDGEVINSNTTWTTGNTYYVTGVMIKDATLTIQEGVVVKFAADANFNVGDFDWVNEIEGTVKIFGTENSRVVFTSMHDNTVGETIAGSTGNPSNEDWKGIAVDYGSDINFNYADFRYAYGTTGSFSSFGPAMINMRIIEPSYINNCTIGHVKKTAIKDDTEGDLTVDNLQIFDVERGIYMLGTSLEKYTNLGFGEDVHNIVYASSVIAGDISTWEALRDNAYIEFGGWLEENSVLSRQSGIVYVFDVHCTTKNLTIEAGTILKFTDEGCLEIIGGQLMVNGTSALPVIMTCWWDDSFGGDTNGDSTNTIAEKGDWDGIVIRQNASAHMEYAHLFWGGAYNTITELRALVALTNVEETISTFKDCRFEASYGHGVYSSVLSYPKISNCTFINNRFNGVNFDGQALLNFIDAKNSFRNNDDENGIDIVNNWADPLYATNCDWGTLDETEIAARVSGNVEFLPCYQSNDARFYGINADTIAARELSYEPIGADRISPGAIITYQTGEGHYGKFKIVERNPGNSINIWWETFDGDSTMSTGIDLLRLDNVAFDLDVASGTEHLESDFIIDDEGRLFPLNGTTCYFEVNYITIDGPITSNTTWTSGKTYYLASSLQVEDATLTIEPGAVVKFDDDNMAFIGDTSTTPPKLGTLIINGTEGSRVVFTSKHDDSVGEIITSSNGTPHNDDWGGLRINANSDCQINYADFRYASRTPDVIDAVIEFDLVAPSTLSHCTISHSNDDAILDESQGAVTVDDLYVSNTKIAINLFNGGNFENYTNITTGPDIQTIAFASEDIAGFGDFSSWEAQHPAAYIKFKEAVFLDYDTLARNPDFCYVFQGKNTSETITIEEGVVLKFMDDGYLYVDDGSLRVYGSTEMPVVFTAFSDDRFGGDSNNDGDASTPERGAWPGVVLSGEWASTTMHDTYFYYGGALNELTDKRANLAFNSTDFRVSSFSNCRFESSGGYGVYSFEAEPHFISCSFLNNKKSGIYFSDLGEVCHITTPNCFRNNDDENGYDFINAGNTDIPAREVDWGTNDEAEIQTKFLNTGSGSVTWNPYYREEDLRFYYTNLDTILSRELSSDPIPDFYFNKGSVITYKTSEGNYGKFMVTMEHQNSHGLWWETYIGDSTLSAGVELDRTKNVAFDLDMACGLFDFETDFVVDNNGDLVPLNGTLCYLENPIECIDYVTHDGTIYSSVIWGAGTHYVNGSFQVYTGGSLTILPGAIVKFSDEGQFLGEGQISILGHFSAIGTAEEPIIFTSMNDDDQGCFIEGSHGYPRPGDWKYIESHGYGGPLVEMDYCQVNYGGSSGSNVSFGKATGYIKNSTFEFSGGNGLTVRDYADIEIESCVIQNNSGHGLDYNYYAKQKFINCNFLNNTGSAVYVSTGIFEELLYGNTGTGNGINGVEIRSLAPGYDQYISNDAGPSENKFPFVILYGITMYNSETLDIKAGTVIKFGESGSLNTQGIGPMIKIRNARLTSLKDDEYAGDTNNDGDSTQPAPGDWGGMEFLYNEDAVDFYLSWITYAGRSNQPAIELRNGAGGVIENCHIKYNGYRAIVLSGGNTEIIGSFINDNDGVGIYCGTSDTLNITNCSVNNNTSHGIEVYNSNPSILNNEINNNGGYPIHIYSGVVNKPYYGNNTEGNLMDGIAIRNLTLSVNNTFYPAEQPYIILNNLASYSADTIAFLPNTIVKFLDTKGIETRGAIIADSVVFTSIHDDEHGGDTNNDGETTAPAAGDWAGFEASHGNGLIEMDNCTMRYGGHSSSNYFVKYSTGAYGSVKNSTLEFSARDGLGKFHGGEVEVSGNTISNCARYGIEAGSATTFTTDNNLISENGSHGIYATNTNMDITNNQFENNAGYPVYYYSGCVINTPFTGNTSEGNLVEGFGVNGLSTYGHKQLFPNEGMPYVFTGNYTSYNNDTLEFMPGTIVKFMDGKQIETRGKIIANETIFTSICDDEYDGDTNNDEEATSPAPGNWGGFEANYADGCIELDGCTLRYGGHSTSNTFVWHGNGAGGFVKNSTLEYSAKDAITQSYGSIEVSGNTFNQIAQYGVNDYASTEMLINDNQFLDGAGHAVYIVNSAPKITNNHFKGNAGYPVYFYSGGVINTPFTGNTSDGNLMEGFAINNLSTSAAKSLYPEPGMPYIFVSSYNSTISGDTLEFKPGTVVKFFEGKGIESRGTLIANQSCFTSINDDTHFGDSNNDGDATTPEPGDWAGFEMNYGDVDFLINECTLRYGGHNNSNSLLYFGNGAGGTVQNSILEYSGKYGIWQSYGNVEINGNIIRNNMQMGINVTNVESCIINSNDFIANGSHAVNVVSCGVELTDNHFENNLEYPVYFYSGCVINTPFTGNTSTGNLMEGFVINNLAASLDQTLSPDVDMPYIFNSGWTSTTDATLTFMPGTVVKFFDNCGLSYRGTLHANQTTFTSIHDDSVDGDTNNDGDETTAEPGDWRGLELEYSAGNLEMDGCTLRYAGDSQGKASVNFNNEAGGYIRNSTIEKSGQYGIWFHYGDIEMTNNSFSENTGYSIYGRYTQTIDIVGNQFLNNLTDAVYLDNAGAEIIDNHFEGNVGYPINYMTGIVNQEISGNTSTNNLMEVFHLGSLSTGYQHILPGTGNISWYTTNNLQMKNNDTVWMEEGSVLKFAEGKYLQIQSCHLIADGATFTTIHDDAVGGDSENNGSAINPSPGDWVGLQPKYSAAVLQLSNCTINWAGASSLAGIYANNEPSAYLDNVTISNSAYHGIYWGSGILNVENSDIESNEMSGLYLRDATQATLSDNHISNNGAYGVYANSCNGIVMRGNEVTGNTFNGLYSYGTKENAIDLGQDDPNDGGQNSFNGNDGGNYQIYNDGSHTIDAFLNNWDWDTAEEIDAHIFDDDEDASKGEVKFNPWGAGNPPGFTVTLPEGWSGLSSYIDPEDENIENLFVPIVNEMVILQNENGMYWPGQNVNTLINWDSHSGYKVKMTQESELTFTGNDVENKSVELNAGWNLIPVLSSESAELTDIFDGIDLEMVKEVAGWKVYWPEFGINTLGSLQCGSAYFVSSNSPGTIDFANSGKSSALQTSSKGNLSGLNPWNKIIQTPNTHTIAFPAEIGKLQEGDMIGAFTFDGRCAGLSPVLNSSAAVVLNGNDELSSQKDGFSEGENITFKLYRPATNEEFDLEVSYSNRFDNSGLFHTNGLSAITGITLNGLGVQSGLKESDISIYPNPSTGIFKIDGIEETSTIKIFNAFGEEVNQIEGLFPGEINLSEQPRGVYFISIESEKETYFEKVIIN